MKRQHLDVGQDPSLLRGSFGGVAVVLANLIEYGARDGGKIRSENVIYSQSEGM